MEVATSDGAKPAMAFRAAGRVTKFDGWTRLYARDGDEDEPGLPKLAIGQQVSLRKAEAAQHMTQPPPRYTDGSLVKTLEKEGIGRPSTYAAIISVIQDRGYAEKMGKGGKAPLRATDLGVIVTDALVGHMPSVMDVGFTRDMEAELDDVEEGKIDHVCLLRKFYASFKAELDKAQKDMATMKGGQPTGEACPKCGKKVLKILGKFGWFLACEDKKCGHTANIAGQAGPARPKAEPTPLKCDKCGRPMLKATGRFGPYLCCEGYLAKECDFTMKVTKVGLPARKFKAPQVDVKCECGKKMVIRMSRKGNPFLSCSAFPKCRKAKDVPPELGEQADAAAKAWAAMKEKDKLDAAAMRAES